MSGSKELNWQNFPKRENQEIRNIIKAPEGCFILSADYGQLEARLLAMASKDLEFCADIWTGTDTHMKWSKRIVELYPEILDVVELQNLRDDSKSNLVFAAFYGASKYKIVTYYETKYKVPKEVMEQVYDEFWEMYKDVKKWQKTVVDFYDTYGYVESLSGRRRRGALSLNKIINHPIQSTASFDICLGAGDRLSELAYKLDKPQYQYIINVHDSLEFYIPTSSLEEDIYFITKEMVNPTIYNWINVPLGVTFEVGINWGNLEKIGEVYSSDFYNYENSTWNNK